MRVLLATMQFGRGYRQGTERYLSDLGGGLQRLGHEVVYLAGDPERRGPKVPLGAVVERDPMVLAYPSAGWMSVRGLAPRHLAGLLDEVAPDVVHVANPAHVGLGLLEACRQRRLPYLVTTMDFWWVCPRATLAHYTGRICEGRRPWSECARCFASDHARPAARKLSSLPAAALAGLFAIQGLRRGMAWQDVRRWFRREEAIVECLRAASHVVFPSSATEQAIRPLLGHERFSRIGYGLDARWFETVGRPGEPPREPPTIGFAGALARHKGPHLLLEAVRTLGWRDVPLRLAGPESDNAYVQRLRELAAGLNVDFAGSIPPERMPGYLRSLDLLVVPSTWPENSPYVILEALAVGTSVIATRVGGMADWVGRDDRLFDLGSAASLAEALRRWREGDRAAPATRIGTADEMAQRTAVLYERAMGERGD